MKRFLRVALLAICIFVFAAPASVSQMHAFNGDDAIDEIDVQVVYYIAQGAVPLPDWRERVNYHLERSKKFHQREFAGQSRFTYNIMAGPFVASATPNGFPQDDVNTFYWQIMNEVRHSGAVAWRDGAFPILLVMADCNFSPGYDDWMRACDPTRCFLGPPHSRCDGFVISNGEDRPGTRAGGSRSVYWPDKHIGLGLVTADGWRVPIKGTDGVTYHEGIGHAIGLPHPEPINNSVMGLAQYVDSIQAAWVDDDQKQALNWTPTQIDRSDLFSTFSVYHEPTRPTTESAVRLYAQLPREFKIESIICEVQYGLRLPFEALPKPVRFHDAESQYAIWGLPPMRNHQGLAYRIRVVTQDGASEQIWHYLQVRE